MNQTKDDAVTTPEIREDLEGDVLVGAGASPPRSRRREAAPQPQTAPQATVATTTPEPILAPKRRDDVLSRCRRVIRAAQSARSQAA